VLRHVRLAAFRPSPGVALGLIAIFIALSATSYGQGALSSVAGKISSDQIRSNAVKARHIGAGAVRGVEVKDGSLRAKDFKAGELRRAAAGAKGETGPQGPAGPAGLKGATGEPGQARAFAHINFAAQSTQLVFEAGRARGMTEANLTHPSAGVFCFSGLGFDPVNVVVSPSASAPGRVASALLDASGCPSGTQVRVTTSRFLNGAWLVDDGAFFISIN
jgi:hypothetical protein